MRVQFTGNHGTLRSHHHDTLYLAPFTRLASTGPSLLEGPQDNSPKRPSFLPLNPSA